MTKNRKLQYKQTPIGLIPEDWEVKKLGELCKIKKGEQLNKIGLNNTDQYPVINGGVTPSGYTEKWNTLENTITISEGGNSCGFINLITSKFWSGGHCYTLLQIKEGVEKKYLFFYLKNNERKIMKLRVGSGLPNIQLPTIFNLLIILPHIPEQQKIATILSTWDTAIDNCKAIIKKLKERNKGLARVLLSGKMRVKEFEGTNDNNYKNLSRFIHEVSIRNTDLKVNKVLSVTNARGFINQLEQFDREVASNDLRNYKIVKKGQFAYNPSRVNVGSLDLLINFNEGILSPMYIVFEANNKLISSKFLYYHLKSYWFIRHIPMFVQGSVRDSLSFDGLSSIKFFIPSIEEQQSIANILDTAVAELNNYEQKLLILQQQKKGLMQQLLTGKRRIKTII